MIPNNENPNQGNVDGSGHGHEHSYNIRINNRPFVVTQNEISYEEVVNLSGVQLTNPNQILTVTYERGHGNKPEGLLIPGQMVKLKEGMQFYVKLTNNS